MECICVDDDIGRRSGPSVSREQTLRRITKLPRPTLGRPFAAEPPFLYSASGRRQNIPRSLLNHHPKPQCLRSKLKFLACNLLTQRRGNPIGELYPWGGGAAEVGGDYPNPSSKGKDFGTYAGGTREGEEEQVNSRDGPRPPPCFDHIHSHERQSSRLPSGLQRPGREERERSVGRGVVDSLELGTPFLFFLVTA